MHKGRYVSFDGKKFKAAEELSLRDKRVLKARWGHFLARLDPMARLRVQEVKMSKAEVLHCYLQHAQEDLVL